MALAKNRESANSAAMERRVRAYRAYARSALTHTIKKLKKQVFPIVTVALTITVMLLLDVFALSFSSVYLILMGAFAGLMLTVVQRIQSKNNSGKENDK